MGQTQSQPQTDTSAIDDTSKETPPNDPPPPSSSSMESLIAEAAAYGDDENESIDAKARKALECPCIADLRKGACGSQFSEAFLCFMKSAEEAKGSDCVHPFVALQSCIKANPDAFPKDSMGDDQVKEEQESSAAKHRILPPKWALETSSLKPRL